MAEADTRVARERERSVHLECQPLCVRPDKIQYVGMDGEQGVGETVTRSSLSLGLLLFCSQFVIRCRLGQKHRWRIYQLLY